MKIQRHSTKHYKPLRGATRSCCSRWVGCASIMARFLLVGLGLFVLFETERDALDRVVEQANEEMQLETNGNTRDNALATRHIEKTFSACLILQNEHENQYLTEWLAYHWHVLPLRRLIVWKDPLSETSPESILSRWHEKMDITVWDRPQQIYPVRHPDRKKQHFYDDYQQDQDLHDKLHARNQRQKVFLGMCLRTLKREGLSWTILSHTDEYALINPRVRNTTDPLHDRASIIHTGTRIVEDDDMESHDSTSNKNDDKNNSTNDIIPLTIPSQNESGSVLKWLQRTQPYASIAARTSPHNVLLKQPCIPLTSKQFGTYERKDANSLKNDLNNNRSSAFASFWNSSSSSTMQRQDFLTLRWQYWGHELHEQNKPKVRTHLLDLSRIPVSFLHWKVDSHRPIPRYDICPIQVIHERDNMFVVHHYAGTTERLKYGDTKTKKNPDELDDITATTQLIREERLHQDTIHNTFWEGNTVPQWLDGFVESVGPQEAKRLLEGVGHLQ
ncbi:expressed unknown protein [Seminavis robusta]|uniref:Uncharacterized protein n=1 Tax=Seminavis robusta TaxID=568900 RepID=A0A9N8DGF1_9STRA|nr:expressed unknown protein [Seminavis robusta]|eukprot:Sro139_g065080.1 n/a (502) ;mRNA; r:48026-49531